MSLALALLLLGVLISRRQLGEALRHAHSDELTGLPNRGAVDYAFLRMAGQAARDGTLVTAMLFDIDHFKSVNDTYGHAKGDDVLAAIGAAARGELRAGDFVGRFGGEEFVLFASDTGEAGARRVAENLQRAFRKIEVAGVDRKITASFGIAAGRGCREELHTLLTSADEALYRAKDNGRDRIEIASEREPEAVAVAV